jgi:hypothetical protein
MRSIGESKIYPKRKGAMRGANYSSMVCSLILSSSFEHCLVGGEKPRANKKQRIVGKISCKVEE